jgi:Family of unknown function (DUF6281)
MSTYRWRGLAGGLLVVLTAAGCGSPGTERGSADASCAFTVTYQGHIYIGSGVGVAPHEGKSLGRATLPACNDTGQTADAEPAEAIELAEVEGVPPSVALAWRGHPHTLLIREDLDYGFRLPSLGSYGPRSAIPATSRSSLPVPGSGSSAPMAIQGSPWRRRTT